MPSIGAAVAWSITSHFVYYDYDNSDVQNSEDHNVMIFEIQASSLLHFANSCCRCRLQYKDNDDNDDNDDNGDNDDDENYASDISWVPWVRASSTLPAAAVAAAWSWLSSLP